MNPFDSISAPIEQTIATGLSRIFTVVRSQAWARAMIDGITPTQSDILQFLSARNTPLRLSVVAQQLAISAATASEAVNTLTIKGLVLKVRAPEDGRALALSLTPRGKQLAAAGGEFSGLLSISVQALTPDQQSLFLSLIVKIIKTMQERGDISITRMCVNCDYYVEDSTGDPQFPHYCNLVKSPFADRHLRLDCPEHRQRTGRTERIIPVVNG